MLRCSILNSFYDMLEESIVTYTLDCLWNSCRLYVNGKMRPVETIPRMGEGG
jgi:hypothetical protein